MSQPSVNSGLQMWTRAPKTVIQRMLPLPMVTAEELGECKKQGEQGNQTGPDSWAAYEEMKSASPEAYIFPGKER